MDPDKHLRGSVHGPVKEHVLGGVLHLQPDGRGRGAGEEHDNGALNEEHLVYGVAGDGGALRVPSTCRE